MTVLLYIPELRQAGYTFLLCSLMVTAASTQTEQNPKLHTPAEIMKIMEESKLTYEIGEDSLLAAVDSPEVLSNQMYLREKTHGHSLEMLSLSDGARPVYDQAEAAFNAGEFGKAITLYREVLSIQPEYVHSVTLIGDAFFSMGQFDSARAYFSRSIEQNFADYEAHWFLADTYKKLGKNEAALQEATIAHLLNVNHANLQKAIRYYRERTVCIPINPTSCSE
jgi:tetratricopeptide (TPR) repeat protein